MVNVWRIYFCREHRRTVLEAYPRNGHTRLVVEVGSSIMIRATFA